MLRGNYNFIGVVLAVVLFICSIGVQAQAPCGTDLDPAVLNYILSTKEQRNRVHSSKQILQFPVQHHVFRDSAGRSSINEDDLEDAFQIANTYYSNASIEFYHCGPINFINNPDLYDFKKSQESVLIDNYQVANVINVYHFNSVRRNNGETLCGYATFPSSSKDFVVMSASCTRNGSTLSHEFGHYFSLFHTHETTNGKEYVNGTNCTTAGDGFCDTPADPNLTGEVTNLCIYSGNETDPLGDFYEPDPTNIMSYSLKVCRNNFTPSQYQQLENSSIFDRDYLSCPTIAPQLNCVDAITLTCNISYHGDSSQHASSISHYGCSGESEIGPEIIHKITIPYNGTLQAQLSNHDPTLSVYILGSCNPNDCVGNVDMNSATFTTARGGETYYIVVDADSNVLGPYILTVICKPIVGGHCDYPDSISSSNVTANDLLLKWHKVTSFSNYELRYRPQGLDSWSYNYTSDSIMNLNGLYCGAIYEWQIRTFCSSNAVSTWSSLQNFTTNSCLTGFDLLVANAYIAKNLRIETGNSYEITLEIKNNSSNPIGGSTYKIYLSEDDLLSGEDVLLTSGTLGSLSVGQYVTLNRTIIILDQLTCGAYNFIAQVDADDSYMETNEINNTFSSSIDLVNIKAPVTRPFIELPVQNSIAFSYVDSISGQLAVDFSIGDFTAPMSNESFFVQLATTQNFSNLFYEGYTNNRNFTLSGFPDTSDLVKFYWRVARENCSGKGDYSQTYLFHVGNIGTGVGSKLSGENQFIVYPNPASDRLNIQFVSNEKQQVSIALFNSLGQELSYKELSQNGADLWVDVSAFRPGVYFIKVNLNDQAVIKKVLIN